MKIDRHQLPPNLPGPYVVERIEFIYRVKADHAARAQALGHRLANFAKTFWHQVAQELALNGSAIALPPTPKLELFYGIEPQRTIGYAPGPGFFDDPILTLPGVIGIALIDPQNRGLLLRIHLENENVLSLSPQHAYNKRPEDIGLAKDLGCKLFRYSISWSRVEPSPGLFRASVLDHYRKITDTVIEAGMLPLVALHHFTWPIHVQERGGMTAKEFPYWYAAYVKVVVQAFGEKVPYWVTFNEPNLLVYGYVKPWWQPAYLVPPGTLAGKTLSEQMDSAVILIRNIFLAHRLARETIRAKNPDARVGVNPFVLGLPGPLQFFVDLLATRTRSHKSFTRRNRKMAEQPLLALTTVDLIISRFTPARERAASVAFSHPYAEGVERLVLREGGSFSKN
jgi:hypothetical protein